MSFCQSIRTVLRLRTVPVLVTRPPKNIGNKQAFAPVEAITHALEMQPSLLFTAHQICASISPAPRPGLQKEISDPLSKFIEKKTPTQRSIPLEISLPNLKDLELIEPPKESVVEKRAVRLIVIRRAKMNKHKWRKLQKRMKFIFAKIRQNRELVKEKAFQAELLAQVKEAEKFDAEEFVTNKLKTAHWVKPITRVRGFFAPDWVIRDHLREKENERKLKERINDCLRFKK